jgi:hypothetical protein
MVGVIAGQLVLKTVDGGQCHVRAVELGDRDGPVEGDDRRGVEADTADGPFACITPSTETCAVVVSFMIAVPSPRGAPRGRPLTPATNTSADPTPLPGFLLGAHKGWVSPRVPKKVSRGHRASDLDAAGRGSGAHRLRKKVPGGPPSPKTPVTR